MKLLNLILIVLIITIQPFISLQYLNFLNNGLVFIKPENLTKTELVEKFKELSSSKSLNELKNIKSEDKKDDDKITFREYLKSNYLKLSTFILKYKNLISFMNLMNKIALFTILIKYLRKIRIMSFIFRIINYIFLSTLGIFMTDIYGLKEIFSNIEYYWMEYVNFIHENKIYKILVKIFHIVNDEDIIEVKSEVKSEVIKIEDKVNENKIENKIEEIINSEIPSSGSELKNEKIIHDKTSWGNKQENWFQINKYYWIGLSIVSLGLIYIYWDSITELFNNIKPDDDGNTTNESTVFLDHQEEYKKYFKEIDTNNELYDLDVIKAQNKGKIMDYIDVSNTKWEDSPTTPKASTSNLPKTERIMMPISKK